MIDNDSDFPQIPMFFSDFCKISPFNATFNESRQSLLGEGVFREIKSPKLYRKILEFLENGLQFFGFRLFKRRNDLLQARKTISEHLRPLELESIVPQVLQHLFGECLCRNFARSVASFARDAADEPWPETLVFGASETAVVLDDFLVDVFPEVAPSAVRAFDDGIVLGLDCGSLETFNIARFKFITNKFHIKATLESIVQRGDVLIAGVHRREDGKIRRKTDAGFFFTKLLTNSKFVCRFTVNF